MATTKLYLDTRANASGTPVPIKISLCHQGRTVLHSTGIKVLPRQWDEKTCKVVRHPQAMYLNTVITSAKNDWDITLIKLSESGKAKSANGPAELKQMILECLYPEKFCSSPEETTWMSATVTTLDDRIIPYIKEICKRDPFSGGVVTGGIVTVKDSGWLMSWTINRQPQFRTQKPGECVVWVYGLFPDKEGDFIHKAMRECTGKEICMEWLYHIGVPCDQIEMLATESANTVPVMMPYITAFFMPRSAGDRPLVVPEGAVNFAFLGQFAETARDTIFTTEYSMRTGMEAVYTLLDIDRGVPEVWGSTYDIRDLLNAAVQIRDGKPITDISMGMKEKMALHMVLDRIKGTDIEKLLREYKVI